MKTRCDGKTHYTPTGKRSAIHSICDCVKPTHTLKLVDLFDRFCASDMERKDNIAAMRLEVIRADYNHQELLAAAKEVDTSVGKTRWPALKRLHDAIAKAEGE
jgi:hypothetical protein